MKSEIDRRLHEDNMKMKKLMVRENLHECYFKVKNNENIDTIIEQHKRFINSLQINGKPENIYKTIKVLEHYKNTQNKSIAFSVLESTLCNSLRINQ
jgi:hypothetical protein